MGKSKLFRIIFERLRIVVRDPNITMQEKALLHDLLLYAGLDGEAFPSELQLAKDMGVTDRCIRNILTRLKKKKLIYVERRFNASNKYFFNKEIYFLNDIPTRSADRNSSSSLIGTNVPEVLGTTLPTKGSQVEISHLNKSQKDSMPIFTPCNKGLCRYGYVYKEEYKKEITCQCRIDFEMIHGIKSNR